MADNLSYPVAAGTVLETVQQPGGPHRPVHRVPESDALLSQLLTAVALLATHADEVSLLAKAEQMRALLAAPVLATGAATETTLLAIKAALLAQVELANLIVTDGTSFYVRRETVNEGTGAVAVNFTTLAGAAASPNTAALTPVTGSGGGGGNTRTVETALFDVTTAGTGTSVGDVIARVLVYDTAANSVVASYWHNLTTGAALASAPSAGAIVSQPRNLALGAAKDSSLQSILTALAAVLKVAQPDVASSGTIASATLNAAFTVALANGQGVVGFALTGLTAAGATLIAEASNDGGTTFQPANLISKVFGDGTFSTTATADGNYRINAGGHTHVRLRVSAVGTGAVNVAALASSQNPVVSLAGPVAQTADQDPIFDHANGKKVSVTASAAVLTPPAGCKYLRISCDADVVINAAGQAAVDDGTSVRIVANAPEVIPVTAGVAVFALSLSGAAAVVRATPMKVRS